MIDRFVSRLVPRAHRQLDWLWSRQGRRGRPHERLCPSGHAGDLGPGLEGPGPGGSILAGRGVIAAEVEEIVDPVMGGEEALSLAGGCKPLHLPLASPRRLVGVFCSVVEAL